MKTKKWIVNGCVWVLWLCWCKASVSSSVIEHSLCAVGRSQFCHTIIHFSVEKCRAHENIIDKTIYKIVCIAILFTLFFFLARSNAHLSMPYAFRFQSGTVPSWIRHWNARHKKNMHRCNKHTLCFKITHTDISVTVAAVYIYQVTHGKVCILHYIRHPLSFHKVYNFPHTMNSHSLNVNFRKVFFSSFSYFGRCCILTW